jgi:hypothetical protein
MYNTGPTTTNLPPQANSSCPNSTSSANQLDAAAAVQPPLQIPTEQASDPRDQPRSPRAQRGPEVGMLAVAAASATGEKLPGESAGGGVGDRWSGRGGDRVSWDGTETADETGQEWCRGIKSAGGGGC